MKLTGHAAPPPPPRARSSGCRPRRPPRACRSRSCPRAASRPTTCPPPPRPRRCSCEGGRGVLSRRTRGGPAAARRTSVSGRVSQVSHNKEHGIADSPHRYGSLVRGGSIFDSLDYCSGKSSRKTEEWLDWTGLNWTGRDCSTGGQRPRSGNRQKKASHAPSPSPSPSPNLLPPFASLKAPSSSPSLVCGTDAANNCNDHPKSATTNRQRASLSLCLSLPSLIGRSLSRTVALSIYLIPSHP